MITKRQHYDTAEPPFKLNSGNPLSTMPLTLTAPMKRRVSRRALR
jgi:hypothetical protein